MKSLGGGSLTDARINMLLGNWYKTFLLHNPVDYISALNIPILALYGAKDVQVSASEHAKVMQKALIAGGNKASKLQVLADHNHLFQTSKTGAMTEYQHIEETLSNQVLKSIEQWIAALN